MLETITYLMLLNGAPNFDCSPLAPSCPGMSSYYQMARAAGEDEVEEFSGNLAEAESIWGQMQRISSDHGWYGDYGHELSSPKTLAVLVSLAARLGNLA